MADSNITKRALAAALRELMEEMPFEKIQVTHICERCQMNRKSFYYHFKDKYDLLNWIFDTEILSFVQHYFQPQKMEERIEEVRAVCHYFYENRNFYRKALQVQGQNSFSEHFREYVMPIIKIRISRFTDAEDVGEFELNFFADAVTCGIERWLTDKNCMPPDEFVDKLLYLLQRCTETLYKELHLGEEQGRAAA